MKNKKKTNKKDKNTSHVLTDKEINVILSGHIPESLNNKKKK